MLHAGDAVPQGVDLLLHGRAVEYETAAGTGEYVDDIVRRKLAVGGNGYGAGGHQRKIYAGPVVVGLSHESRLRILAAQSQHTGTQRTDAVAALIVAGGADLFVLGILSPGEGDLIPVALCRHLDQVAEGDVGNRFIIRVIPVLVFQIHIYLLTAGFPAD